MNYPSLVLRNLWRSRRRTILTTISIAVSMFVFTTLMALPTLVAQVFEQSRQALRIVCQSNAGFGYLIPEAYARPIAAIPHVVAVAGSTFFIGTYQSPSDLIRVFAVDHEQIRDIWPDWKISPAIAKAFGGSRIACIVARDLADRYGWHPGTRIMLHGNQLAVDLPLEIVGIVGDEAPPRLVLIRRDYLDEVQGRTGNVMVFWVKVDGAGAIPGVVAAIDSRFKNSPYETRSEAESAFYGEFLRSVNVIYAMAQIFAVIVIVVIGLVAANTAGMSIRERLREVAIMRAIGFRRGPVLLFLLAENVAIGAAGWLIGCAGAFALLRVLYFTPLVLAAIAARLPNSILAASLAVAIVISVAGALGPAIGAVRRNVADGLRMVA